MTTSYTIQKMGAGYMDYITLDTKTVKRVTAGGNKRVLCTINSTLVIHAAVMKNKEGIYYVMISLANKKKLGVNTGSTINVKIEIDTSELQFHIAEEFAEVMATDQQAEKIFNELSPGNKRGLVALVNMVKSSDKKIERALKIADKLKLGITSPQKIMQ